MVEERPVFIVLAERSRSIIIPGRSLDDITLSWLRLTFARYLFCPLLSVAFEQLVDEREFILFFHRIEGWEGVAFVLEYSHLRPVQVLSVGDPCHPRVAARLSLEPRRKDLEELRDQVFFLGRYKQAQMKTTP